MSNFTFSNFRLMVSICKRTRNASLCCGVRLDMCAAAPAGMATFSLSLLHRLFLARPSALRPHRDRLRFGFGVSLAVDVASLASFPSVDALVVGGPRAITAGASPALLSCVLSWVTLDGSTAEPGGGPNAMTLGAFSCAASVCSLVIAASCGAGGGGNGMAVEVVESDVSIEAIVT